MLATWYCQVLNNTFFKENKKGNISYLKNLFLLCFEIRQFIYWIVVECRDFIRNRFLYQNFSFGNVYYKRISIFSQGDFFVMFCHFYSVRSASTGSFLLAILAGIQPPISVKMTLIVTKIIA